MAPDPNTDNQGNEAERPSWLPDNFKSPEDFADAYKEAQRKITEQGQQLSAVEQNYEELAGQLEQFQAEAQTPRVDPQTATQQFEDWYMESPAQATAWLIQQSQQNLLGQIDQKLQSVQNPTLERQGLLEAEYITANLANKFDDFEQYQAKTAELIQNNPHWVPADLPLIQKIDAVEAAYKIAKYEDLQSQSAQATDLAQQLEREKLAAQTATGAGGNPMPQSLAETEWARIRSAGSKSSGF